MNKLRAFWIRLFNTLRRAHHDRDFAEELEAHLAMDVERGVLNGLSRDEARRQALIRCGGIAQAREAYTHRVAISNHRLVGLEDGHVTFRWRDSAHGNKKKLMTLPVDEFLRRFLLHVLPRGFVRIRHFGFLASRRRASLLPICFQLLRHSTQHAPPAEAISSSQPLSLWRCPRCGGTMRTIERISAAELLLRSPPQAPRCAA